MGSKAGLRSVLFGVLTVFVTAGIGALGPVATKAATSTTAVLRTNVVKASTTRTLKSPTGTALIPVVVSKDVDGDTIHVTMPDGQDKTIRMLLIDTPETVDPYKPVEPFGPQASAFAKADLPVGKHIFIEEGKPGYQTDKYGRLLAFVYLSPTDMYNADVVKRGLGRVAYIYPPNTQHLDLLKADEQFASQRHLGIWSIPGYATPNGFNLVATRKTSNVKSTQPGSHTVAPSGITVISSNLDVSPGDHASITIHTTPGAQGTIEVDYKSGPSHARGLDNQIADSRGDITWTWEVGTRTTPGTWPVLIRCGTKTLQLGLVVQ